MMAASNIVQLTALSLVPTSSLVFNRPIAPRPRTIHRHWDRNRNAIFPLALLSSEEDNFVTKSRVASNCGDDSSGDPGSESSVRLDGRDLKSAESNSPRREEGECGTDAKMKAEMADGGSSSLVDDLWEGALLQTMSSSDRDVRRESVPAQEQSKLSPTAPVSMRSSDEPPQVVAGNARTAQKNPRMQMFAYLSQPVVEVRVILLVGVSCFLQAINTLDDLPPVVHRGINNVDDVFVFIFAVEFFLRWWSAGRFQFRYLAKPLAAIDAIVVILPLFLSGLLPIWDFAQMIGMIPYVSLPGWLLSISASSGSTLLNLRLLRLLKFQRVLTDKNTYANFQMALGMRRTDDVRPYQLQIARTVTSIFTLVSVSTGLIYTAEHEVNPQIPDYFTALYFGLTTLTTVGFGDITPQTSQGRLVVACSILAGVAIIPAQAAGLAEAYLDFQKERPVVKRGPKTSKRECGRCGAGPHRRDALFCWSCGELLD